MDLTAIKIGVAAGLLYYGVLRGASALMVGVRSYMLRGLDLATGTVTLQLNFVISNPLWVGIRLRSIDGEVYVQGVKCGVVDMRYDYYMSGRRTHTIPVLLTLDSTQLTEAAIASINTGNINTLTVDFDGGITVGKSDLVRIPIKKTLTWEDLKG